MTESEKVKDILSMTHDEWSKNIEKFRLEMKELRLARGDDDRRVYEERGQTFDLSKEFANQLSSHLGQGADKGTAMVDALTSLNSAKYSYRHALLDDGHMDGYRGGEPRMKGGTTDDEMGRESDHKEKCTKDVEDILEDISDWKKPDETRMIQLYEMVNGRNLYNV